MGNDERWQLRYENFKKALSQLKEAVNQKSHSKLEIAGTIKTFEFGFELAWKTLKDFLEKEGFEVKTPRETIKQAFQSGFIENGQLWLEALDNRNLSHSVRPDRTLIFCFETSGCKTRFIGSEQTIRRENRQLATILRYFQEWQKCEDLAIDCDFLLMYNLDSQNFCSKPLSMSIFSKTIFKFIDF